MSNHATKDSTNDAEFAIQKIYVKDVSFESPNSPKSFRIKSWTPEINVELASSHQKLEDNIYEVVLTITVTAKQEDKTAFLIEIKQAGIFTIKGYPPETHDGMIGVFCPETLFPYAREAISEIVTKGGFPQMLLTPVNFNAMYTQHLQQQAKENNQTH